MGNTVWCKMAVSNYDATPVNVDENEKSKYIWSFGKDAQQLIINCYNYFVNQNKYGSIMQTP